MLAAVQGMIKGNSVLVDANEIKPFDGKSVTVIINEYPETKSKQDKSKFFSAVGQIDLNKAAVDELRTASMI